MTPDRNAPPDWVQVHDFGVDREGVKVKRPALIPTLILLSNEQFRAATADLPEISRIRDRGPALTFIPFGHRVLAIPHCVSPESDIQCRAISGGPDDNPFAWTCVCSGPREDPDIPIAVQDDREEPPQVPDCRLEVVVNHDKWGRPIETETKAGPVVKITCVGRNCPAPKSCKLGLIKGQKGQKTVACFCVGKL